MGIGDWAQSPIPNLLYKKINNNNKIIIKKIIKKKKIKKNNKKIIINYKINKCRKIKLIIINN